MLNKNPGKGKWDPKSEEVVLVGYCSTTKAQRLCKPDTKTTTIPLKNVMKTLSMNLIIQYTGG